jgi:peptidoglycan/xylan/chitin deacetylase (PgdA/CDA1 family)
LGEGPIGLPSAEKNFWVDPRLFIEILDAVGRRRDVQLTFDDGNLSDFTIALPELVKRNLKGWFFIVADRLGREGFLTSEQLQAMVAEGMVV